MKARATGRFMAAAAAFAVAFLGAMAPGRSQAADYQWDGAADTWGSLHWTISPDPTLVAGPTVGGNTAAISGGTVSFAQHDTFGNANTTSSPVITLGAGATLASGGWFTTMWGLNLAGGTLLANGGANPSYPAFQLAGTLSVSGTSASAINAGGGNYNSVNVGGNGNVSLVLDVADVTLDADADLTISTVLQNSPHGAGSLIKTGAGTLTLSARNIYTGSTLVNGGALNVATNGALLGTGVVNPVSGGVLTLAGPVTVADNGAFAVGNGTAGLGTVNIETGAVVSIGNGSGGYVGRTYIGGKLDGAGSLGAGTLNINGGVLNVAAAGAVTVGDGARFWLNAWGNAGAALNLNGGTLSTARTIADGAGASAPVRFNGGTLQAAASLFPIIEGVAASIAAGGVTIDSQNYNVGISLALAHGAGAPDGGLTKLGAGTLTLGGANTFNGNLVINNGTVSDTLAANTGTPTATGLGNMTTAGRQVQVNSGATLLFSQNDPIGSATVLQNAAIVVDNGTVDHGSYFVTLPNVTLKNGATLTGGDGVVGNYQTFNLMGSVTVSGTSGSTMATTGSSLTGVHLGNGNISFIVNQTGASPDLTVSAPLVNMPGSLADSGFTKAGAGTMVLAAANGYSGAATVSEGILVALSAAALPGYGVAGKVALAPGAGLSVGVGNWSDSAIADLINTGVYGAGTLFGFDTTAGNYAYDGTQFTLPAVAGLVKTGTNLLTIAGGNTCAGGVTARGGILRADFGTGLPNSANVTLTGASLASVSGSITAALGTGAGQITFSPGTLVGFSAIDVPLTVNLGGAGEALSWGSAAFNPSAFVLNDTGANTNLTFANGLDLNSANRTVTVNAAPAGAEAVVSGVVADGSGAAGLVKAGAGRLVLSAPNTYSGGTFLNAGTLALSGGDDRLSTGGAITVNAGTLDLGGGTQATAGAVVLANGLVTNGTLSKSGAAYDVRGGTVAATLAGSAGLTKTTAGTLFVSGANTYTGNTFLNAGTTVIDGGSISNAAYFDVGAIGSPASFILSSGAVTAGSQFVIGAHGASSGVQSNGTLQVNGVFYMGGYGDGPGVGTYAQLGGTVTVASGMNFGGGGPNAGVYSLAGGLLTAPSFSKNGSGAATFNFNGGTLKPLVSSASFMQGLTAANVQLGGALIDTAGLDVTIRQPLLHDAALGALSDGGLAKLGAGTLTLSGTNSYNGTTTISSGTLRLGVANAIVNSGAVHVAGGVFDLGGFTVNSGTVTLSAGSIVNGTLNASSYELTGSGSILANLGGGALVKSGDGTAALYGGNTSTGETAVTQGTLTLAKLGFANCRLWLDASDAATLFANSDGTGAITASGQTVGYWGDLSGGGKPATQADAARRPAYVAAAAEFNGRPVLEFDGADDDITSLLDINAANIPNITIMMVCRQVTYKTNGGLWGHDDGSWDRLQLLNFLGVVGDNNIAGSGNSITVKGMNTADAMVYTVALKNGVVNGSYVYVNGVSDGANGLPAFTSQEGTTGLASFTLANISAGSGYCGNIQIGEVLVFDTALSDVTRRNAEAYLRNKWMGASDPLTPVLATNGAVRVASGAVLNLDGASHTVASVSGDGTVSNGALAVTGTLAPGGDGTVGTLTFAASPVLSGATLLADVAAGGACDRVAASGDLSLAGLALQVADLGLLNTQQSYTLATCSGALTGSFAATNLPENWQVRYTRTPGAGSVRILYAPRGTMIRML